MLDLLAKTIRWCARHFLAFVVIVAILAAADLAQKEFRRYESASEAMQAVQNGREKMPELIDRLAGDTAGRLGRLRSESSDAIARRLVQVKAELDAKSKQREALPRLYRCAFASTPACEQAVERVRLDAELWLLTEEFRVLTLSRQSVDGARELERLRQAHMATQAELTSIENQAARMRAELEAEEAARPWWKLPDFFKRWELKQLEKERFARRDRNERAFRDYEWQRLFLEALEKPIATTAAQLRQSMLAQFVAPFEQELAHLQSINAANWLVRLKDWTYPFVPTALLIIALAIVTPTAIKAFCYYVIAPLASRCPPVRLTPYSSGSIEHDSAVVGGVSERLKISAVSQPVGVHPDEELYVHPEYIQSSAMHSAKDTKLLFDWSYPLTSLAAGLYPLTRIRPETTETVVVSSTRDPFIEIGLIALPKGSSVVLQPHCLVGLVQRRDSPLRITSVWRLGSLHAWLTLQLRFLVFHGPVRLLIKGCRGVRLEAAGAGRAVNQAATIGFSANLDYATTRCETFVAYLTGKQELFNDRFSNGPGEYLYEEMPHFGKRTGYPGRGLEGLFDTILKTFGI